MDWVFQHLQIIIAVAAAIAYMFNRGKQAPDAGGAETGGDDAERARQIREEIRRKITERRQGAAPSIPEPAEVIAPPPVLHPQRSVPPIDPFGGPTRPALPTFRRTRTELRPVPLATEAETMAVLERQEQLAEQMKALEDARLKQQRRAADVVTTAAATAAASASRGALLADLRHPQGLRRAIVLREVLGAPVALR